jgi:4-amino-4-deoxy-L-arabinose transferase-like glycosyltransferase
LALVWLCATAWLRPLAIPDEGRYVGVAWDMLRSGDWLVPRLDGYPYFHKPPLFYWITASSLALIGHNELASRVAPIMGALIGVLSLFLFLRHWVNQSIAVASAAILLVQPFWFLGGQYANLDMLVAGFISATILLLAHAVLCMRAGSPYRVWLMGAYACAGLGMLSKGLIGIVLPGAVVLVWLLLCKDWRHLWRLVSLPGLLVFLLLVAPWFVAMQTQYSDFSHYFFYVQHFQRFAGAGFNSAHPFYFYAVILFANTLGWLFWVLIWLKKRPALVAPKQASLILLMWVWFLVIVLFFSIPRSKLVGYILPCIPPLACLLAFVWHSLAQGNWRAWWASASLGLILSLVVVGWASYRPISSVKPLALELKHQHQGSDPIVMLQHYYFDLPFYSQIGRSVMIVDQWALSETRNLDDWHKEIRDASRFEPTNSTPRLIELEQFEFKVLCQNSRIWVVGANTAELAFPVLRTAKRVAFTKDDSLWLIDFATQKNSRPSICG